MKPLAIDLFCGLGGWTEGLLAAGFEVVGFDIEQHVYGEDRYPAQLVVQDVLTLHGSQFASADLIVASPPCQAYSYMAMPWSRAKAKAAMIRADETGVALAEINALFNACFRIQREAVEAAGRDIPMVVENVRGAIPWVGRSRWNFGSYHLWGDVPALMPLASVEGTKVASADGGSRTAPGKGARFTSRDCGVEAEGAKAPGKGWFNDSDDPNLMAMKSSKSPARKAASAKIAKIPLSLSQWIGQCYLPRRVEASLAFHDAQGARGGCIMRLMMTRERQA